MHTCLIDNQTQCFLVSIMAASSTPVTPSEQLQFPIGCERIVCASPVPPPFIGGASALVGNFAYFVGGIKQLCQSQTQITTTEVYTFDTCLLLH